MDPTTSVVTEPIVSVLEAIHPFQADDSHKGTFLLLRIAGLEQGMALRLVRRKYRSWQNWRATDEDFRRLEEQIPALAQRFGGEARVVRTALLDISIVETGISIFKQILNQKQITDGQWTYAVKMAGLRVPMMGVNQNTGSPWERLANSIKNTLNQKELIYSQAPDGTKSITAKETIIEPSAEQKALSNGIVQQMLESAGVGS